jgi:EpsI family protein
MTATARLLATVAGLAIPGLILVQWNRTSEPGPDFANMALDEKVGEWKATQDLQLDTEVLELIDPDHYFMRLYQAPGRLPIWLYVGIYGGRAGYAKGAHDPKNCYPAQGWEITATRYVDLPVGNSETLVAKSMDVVKSGRTEAVVYWFQPATRWPSDPLSEQLWIVVDAVTGSPQHAFVRVSTGAEDREAAARDLAEFAGEIAPLIRRILVGPDRYVLEPHPPSCLEPSVGSGTVAAPRPGTCSEGGDHPRAVASRSSYPALFKLSSLH